MKERLSFFIFITLIWCLFLGASHTFLALKAEAVRYDPHLEWQVLETPHFSVHFFKPPDNQDYSYRNEQLAQEVAHIAEEVFSQIHEQIDLSTGSRLSPTSPKIAIIMEDFTDYVQGFASSFPHRVIRLSLTPPNPKSFDLKFKSWLKMVITHEYTHLAHFEMAKGPTAALRALFGQIIVPNGLQPTWAIEGLAVYDETKFNPEGGGRGLDPRYEMYLRMAILENRLNALDQLSGYYLTSWPDGTAPYIYGQSLIHFIAQRYGEDKVMALSEVFCRYPYLGFNYAFKKVLGLDLDQLYQNWKEALQEKYQTQAQKIKAKTISPPPSRQLTNYQYWVDYPRWISAPISTSGASSDKIAIRVSTPHSSPFIQIIDPSASSTPLSLTSSTIKEQSLIKRVYGGDSSFDISPEGDKIIYAKLADYQQFYQFYDLYVYDLNLNKEIRLSEGLRARDPAWSPDPQNPQIVAVINEAGTNNLALINLPLSSSTETSPDRSLSTSPSHSSYQLITSPDILFLTNFEEGTQIYQPAWSPQGDKIAFSAWREGYTDLYLLNLNSADLNKSTLQLIFQDKYLDLAPCWSPDGKYLFFSSDRSEGIYNIFAFSLPQKKLCQITNVLSGAFEPALSPDGKRLAYIEYHSTGYELHLMEIDPTRWEEIEYIEPSSFNLSLGPNLNPINEINQRQLTSPSAKEEKKEEGQQTKNSANLPSSFSAAPSELVKDNYPIHPYHPLASLWPPTFWLPTVQIKEKDLDLGFSTELTDFLGFYSLPLVITYDDLANRLNYSLDYYNYRHLPVINLYLEGRADLDSPLSWPEEGKTGINLSFSSSGQTTLLTSSNNSRPYRQTFSLGYQYKRISLAEEEEEEDKIFFEAADSTNHQNQPQAENLASLRLSYTYSDLEKYGFSISPEQGQAFSLNYEYADKILGSDYSFAKFILEGRKFISLPPLHHVFSLRLVAGGGRSSGATTALPEEEKFKLGGHHSADSLLTMTNSEVNTFALRGYKPGFLQGDHLLLASLEYRFPLANIEHSLKGGPFSFFFLERLSGTLFIDLGKAWDNLENNKGNINLPSPDTYGSEETNCSWLGFKAGIGAELKADFEGRFGSPFTLRGGVAKALNEPEGYDIYLTLGTSF